MFRSFKCLHMVIWAFLFATSLFLFFGYLSSPKQIQSDPPPLSIATNSYQIPQLQPKDEHEDNRVSNPLSIGRNNNLYLNLNQDDPALISYIRSLLRPPSLKPYHLSNPSKKHFTFFEQSKFVGDIYGPGKRDGFFVEVGALDGEESSSTLYLERELGFSGLLIEANPVNYEKLLKKERKSYTISAALSPTVTSQELLFTGSHQQGHLTNKKSKDTITVEAFPFYSIMSAINVTFIDVFNLDIEGFEFKVLKTIPWDKLKFGIFIVEHLNIPEPKKEMVQYMAKRGYEKIHENKFDFIFASQDYLDQVKKPKP